MSVQRYDTADGARWRVRWRDGKGKMRSRSFTSKRDARGFDDDIRARKRQGHAPPATSRQTLAAAFDDWWRLV